MTFGYARIDESEVNENVIPLWRGRKDVKQRIKICTEIKSKSQQGAYAHKLRYSMK